MPTTLLTLTSLPPAGEGAPDHDGAETAQVEHLAAVIGEIERHIPIRNYAI